MSLDLSNKKGVAYNTTPSTLTDFSTVTAATFDGGDIDNANMIQLFVDATAGSVSLDTLPTSLTGSNGQELLVDGVQLTVIKSDVTGNTLSITDPLSTDVFSFVNIKGERYSLVFDGSNTRWIIV